MTSLQEPYQQRVMLCLRKHGYELVGWKSGRTVSAAVAWVDPGALEPYELWSETLRIIALARERREDS